MLMGMPVYDTCSNPRFGFIPPGHGSAENIGRKRTLACAIQSKPCLTTDASS